MITLSPQETKIWEDGGPEGDQFRRGVRDIALGVAKGRKGSVEIYASKKEGGWVADVIENDDE